MDNVKRIINLLTKESEIRNKPDSVVRPYFVRQIGERAFKVCHITECESFEIGVYPFSPYSSTSEHIVARIATFDRKIVSISVNITRDDSIFDMDSFSVDIYPELNSLEERTYKDRYNTIKNSVKGFFKYIVTINNVYQRVAMGNVDNFVMRIGKLFDRKDSDKEVETLEKTEKGEIDMSGNDSGFVTDEREFYKSEGFSVGFFLSRNFVPCIEVSEEYVKKIRKIKYDFMGAINITFKTPDFFDGKPDFDYSNNGAPYYRDIPASAAEFLDVCFTKYNLKRPINRGKIPSSGDVICVNNHGIRRFFLITTFGFVELKMFA